MVPQKQSLGQLIRKKTPEISVHVRSFLRRAKQLGRSDKTHSFYETHLNHFAWWCTEHGIEQPNAVTTQTLEEFAGYLRETEHRWGSAHPNANKPLSESSIAAYFRAVRALFHWLAKEKQYLASDPFTTFEMPKIPDKVIDPLRTEQIRSMMKFTGQGIRNGLRAQALVLLLLDTGVRAKELCSLKLDDVTEDTIKVLGKGNKERFVPMGPRTARAIWLYVSKERPESRFSNVFLTEDAMPLSPWRLRWIVARLGKKANIEGVRCSPHTFRHTFAISCLRSKEWDLLSLKHALGHTRTSTTEIYLKSLNDDDVADRHRRYSPAEALSTR